MNDEQKYLPDDQLPPDDLALRRQGERLVELLEQNSDFVAVVRQAVAEMDAGNYDTEQWIMAMDTMQWTMRGPHSTVRDGKVIDVEDLGPCEQCAKAPANVVWQHTDETGTRQDRHICEPCIKRQGFSLRGEN